MYKQARQTVPPLTLLPLLQNIDKSMKRNDPIFCQKCPTQPGIHPGVTWVAALGLTVRLSVARGRSQISTIATRESRCRTSARRITSTVKIENGENVLRVEIFLNIFNVIPTLYTDAGPISSQVVVVTRAPHGSPSSSHSPRRVPRNPEFRDSLCGAPQICSFNYPSRHQLLPGCTILEHPVCDNANVCATSNIVTATMRSPSPAKGSNEPSVLIREDGQCPLVCPVGHPFIESSANEFKFHPRPSNDANCLESYHTLPLPCKLSHATRVGHVAEPEL
ncbi:hypothetical protein G5I_09857 [Acromyrmex echinatior]|uniref:Uncharacterized protein n=1 Tax=Acromyrmex echinatior TaxID=103372 RepID=F4WV66_ACREC|nr:hypothetical protein G5I_09857 [Acromyrmex echinatior]